MSINTSSMKEINEERAAKRECLAKDRPTTTHKKRKWRDIERINDAIELSRLLSDEIQIG